MVSKCILKSNKDLGLVRTHRLCYCQICSPCSRFRILGLPVLNKETQYVFLNTRYTCTVCNNVLTRQLERVFVVES